MGRFRSMFFSLDDGNNQTVSLCGELNTKNQFGGYTGFLRFVSNSNLISFEHQEGYQFRYIWSTWCNSPLAPYDPAVKRDSKARPEKSR